MPYDPEAGPDAASWLALDEQERVAAVTAFHDAAGETGEGMRVHAIVHVAVENQLAESLPEAVSALERLRAGGLERHEAIHAIASVVAGQVFEALRGGSVGSEAYKRGLADLTVESWNRMTEEE